MAARLGSAIEGETENGTRIGGQIINFRTPQGWETVSKSGLYDA